GAVNHAAYCASKGGVIALTKAAAKEAAPHGVMVNSVAPGPIDTDMLRHSDEFTEAGRAALPIKRFGQPDEIARTVEFLAGPGGDFFVGQIVSPNGGAVI
ncbi:MAG: SDR family oxidoreductase, partial [Dongiaceae bacterium]